MMKRSFTALLLVAFCALAKSEPLFQTASASQTVGAVAFPRYTKTVTIVSDGADPCYFRLFTDVDAAGDATTSSAPLKSGESLSFALYPEGVGASGATSRDSESYVDGRRAAYYKSLSFICATGKTATWRVYYK